jgi:hypothetical protein
MSHQESIYNLIPTPQFKPDKPPLYRSQTDGRVEAGSFELGVKTKKSHATFGKPNGTSANLTTTFTRAHGKEPILPEPKKPTVHKEKIKAPVPKKDEKPVMGLCSNKNFITSNAVEIILSKPQKVGGSQLGFVIFASDYAVSCECFIRACVINAIRFAIS